MDACEYDAITTDEKELPIVDAQKCNGCGKCVAVCIALVGRTFKGGNVRGVEIVTYEEYEKHGTTEYDLLEG